MVKLTRVREVIEEMVNTINSNIDDPVTQRRNRGETWVFDHWPRYEGKTLPRIGIHKVTSGHPPRGINSGVNTRTETDVQISIMTRLGKSYDFDNDGSNEPAEDLLDYLAEQVKTVVENNHSNYTGLGNDVKHVILQNSDTVRPQDENFIMEAMTYEVRIGG